MQLGRVAVKHGLGKPSSQIRNRQPPTVIVGTFRPLLDSSPAARLADWPDKGTREVRGCGQVDRLPDERSVNAH